jgi:signal transduction histidine kinase
VSGKDEPGSAIMYCVGTTNSKQRFEHPSAWRDVAFLALVTLCGGVLAAHFEISEAVFAWTRRWERWQVDELPALLMVLSVGLAWFAWRRYREAQVEIAQRRAAEARLAQLLLENRRLARQYLDHQESDRKSLARELHDELGQYLNAIKIDAVGIQQRVSAPGSPNHQAASVIVNHIDHISAVVRDLIGKLRPVGLDELGLAAALEHCVDGWRQRLPGVRFALSLAGELDTVNESVALAVYRLVQEGLTNASRHADAHYVQISVHRLQDDRAADEIVFRMVDDGRGADFSAKPFGLGLIGMRERVQMLGGQLDISTQPGRGLLIQATVPVSAS